MKEDDDDEDASGNSGKDRGNDADDESDDPTEGFDDGRKKNRKYRDEDRMFVNMGVKVWNLNIIYSYIGHKSTFCHRLNVMHRVR